MTEEEKMIMSIIVMDDEIGSCLVFPRSKDYWALRTEVKIASATALKGKNLLDERQKELLHELLYCQGQIDDVKANCRPEEEG